MKTEVTREDMQQWLEALEVAGDYIDSDMQETERRYKGRPLLQHRIDRQREEFKRHNAAIASLRAEIAAPVQLLPEDAKEAARYRWLKQNCGFGIRKNGVTELSIMFTVESPSHIGRLDAAIDAAAPTLGAVEGSES